MRCKCPIVTKKAINNFFVTKNVNFMQLAYIDVTDFQNFFSNEQDAQTYIISQRTKTTTKAPKWPYHPQQTNVSTLKHKSTTTQSLPTTNQHKFIGKMFEMIIINREKLTLYKSITGITFGIVRERKSQEMGRVWQEAVLRSLSLSLSLSLSALGFLFAILAE